MDKGKSLIACMLLVGLIGVVTAETITTDGDLNLNVGGGDVSSNGNINPSSTSTKDLGTSILYWDDGYINKITFASGESISNAVDSAVLITNNQANGLALQLKGTYAYSNQPVYIYFDINNNETRRVRLGHNANFVAQQGLELAAVSTADKVLFPAVNNQYSLGTSALGWSAVYSNPTSASASTYMCWDGSGVSLLGSCSSLREYKKDIENNPYGLDTVVKLQPRIFKLKSNDVTDIGFIAEEVESVTPALAQYTNGNLSGININAIVSTSVNAIKELKTENDLLKTELCKKDNTYGFCKETPKTDNPITVLNGDLRVTEKYRYTEAKETKNMDGSIKPIVEKRLNPYWL